MLLSHKEERSWSTHGAPLHRSPCCLRQLCIHHHHVFTTVYSPLSCVHHHHVFTTVHSPSPCVRHRHAFTTVHSPPPCIQPLPCLHLLPLCHPCSCRKWLRECQSLSRSPSRVQWQQPGQDHPGQVPAAALARHTARRQQPQAGPACDHLAEREGADASSGECPQVCWDSRWAGSGSPASGQAAGAFGAGADADAGSCSVLWWWELAGAMLQGRSEEEGLDSCLHHPGWCKPCAGRRSNLYVPMEARVWCQRARSRRGRGA